MQCTTQHNTVYWTQIHFLLVPAGCTKPSRYIHSYINFILAASLRFMK